jgi:hypothetical protein
MQHVDRMIVVAIAASSVFVLAACSAPPVPPAEAALAASDEARTPVARRPASAAAQTRRNPAAGTLAPCPLEVRPLALERATICLDTWALCPPSVADRQLDPRLLGAGA